MFFFFLIFNWALVLSRPRTCFERTPPILVTLTQKLNLDTIRVWEEFESKSMFAFLMNHLQSSVFVVILWRIGWYYGWVEIDRSKIPKWVPSNDHWHHNNISLKDAREKRLRESWCSLSNMMWKKVLFYLIYHTLSLLSLTNLNADVIDIFQFDLFVSFVK